MYRIATRELHRTETDEESNLILLGIIILFIKKDWNTDVNKLRYFIVTFAFNALLLLLTLKR
jgi:hypothetical protein